MILSASRRTDIPGYYSEWFMNRLKAGFVLTKNPMNPNQISRITLSPDQIDCIVFWTKDPLNMMDKLMEIENMGYHYYFQFTLTPYGREYEHNLRDKEKIIQTFRQLSKQLGQDRVLWRYDPILLNDNLTIEYHMEKFEELCYKLKSYTKVCTISFVDLYTRLNKKVKENTIKEISSEQMHVIAAGFASIAVNYGIELRACCESVDFTLDGIHPASCIDKDIAQRICGHSVTAKKDRNQRVGCGCVKSVDIGVYNTCKNGCIYCYANHSEASIHNNVRKHNPDSAILIGESDILYQVK